MQEPTYRTGIGPKRRNPTRKERHMQRGSIKIERLIQRGIRHNPFPRKKD